MIITDDGTNRILKVNDEEYEAIQQMVTFMAAVAHDNDATGSALLDRMEYQLATHARG